MEKQIHTKQNLKAGDYYVRMSSSVGSTDIGFQSSVTFKVGFTNLVGHEYTLASVCDGWTQVFKDKQSLCDHLNSDEFGYRQLSKAEFQEQIWRTMQGFDPKRPVVDNRTQMIDIIKEASLPLGDDLQTALMIKAQRFLKHLESNPLKN